MAIVKRPNRNPSDSDKADRFITSGHPGTDDKADKRIPVIVRFKPALFAKIDEWRGAVGQADLAGFKCSCYGRSMPARGRACQCTNLHRLGK